ncbi:Protein CBG17840 [Caenorhabditis briggsae]|uniref:Protein CBG17840 n=1 Tax=Caenorhabditis briggsae TaxID=6238 RepID=A8XRW2_CAEBR|nr:Protein CBG17840 [Caenorhabditis briggsae]CAP35388.1 Protein CBG17840 [Caenorhabditis briggsae]
MIPMENKNLYPISDEDEIDVLNSDDEEMLPEGSFHHQPDEIYMVQEDGEGYYDDDDEDDPLQEYQYVEEDGTYMHDQNYSNPDYVDAHYINTDVQFLHQQKDSEIFEFFENPQNVEFITTDDRLQKYPEMRQLPALRRHWRQANARNKPQLFIPLNGIQLDPLESAGNALLVANKIYPAIGQSLQNNSQKSGPPKAPKVFSRLPSLQPTRQKATPHIRKIIRPKPIVFTEPTTTKGITVCPTIAHGMTPLPDKYFQRRQTLTAEQAGFDSENVICDICNFVFRQKAVYQTHMKKHADQEEEEVIISDTIGLLCPVSDCNTRCDTLATTVKHMKDAHSIQDIVFEKVVFKDMTEFKLWKAELERLTMSKYSRTSGRQNIYSKSTYYQCALSGTGVNAMKMSKVARNHVEHDPLRKRQSKKLEKSCTAFFQVKEMDDGTVVLRGCTKHSGHGRDPRSLPLTDEIKMEIANLLIEGFDETQIVDKLREGTDSWDRKFYLQTYEVRNVYTKIERFKAEYARKMISGEKLPNLADVVRRTAAPQPSQSTSSSARNLNVSNSRAKLACSKYPTANYEQSQHSDSHPDYYPEQQEYEDVIEETGDFHVPETTVTHHQNSGKKEENSMKKDRVKAEQSGPSGIRGNVNKAGKRKRDDDEGVDDDFEEVGGASQAPPSPSRQSMRGRKATWKLAENEEDF